MTSPLTNLLLASMALLLLGATASPTSGYHEQKPQHDHHQHGTPGCGKWHSEVDQLKTITIPTHDGPREFSVYLPADYDKHHTTSIIMSFHGRDTNTQEHALLSRFNDSRTNPDMIAIFPQALDCLWQGPPHAKKIANDLQFTTDMIQYMRENYCIDNDRIYASGFDTGGGFVDSLACAPKYDADFAAFAMVSPALYIENNGFWCKPSRPLPILEIHSADDEVDCYEGGKTKDEGGFIPYPSVPDFLKRWAKRDGCNKTPDTCTKYGGLVNTTSYTCQGIEGFVQGIKVGSQKHRWPSTTTPMHNGEDTIDASKKIIEFFKDHCKKHA